MNAESDRRRRRPGAKEGRSNRYDPHPRCVFFFFLIDHVHLSRLLSRLVDVPTTIVDTGKGGGRERKRKR